jgi:hypothetical protein
MIDPIERIEEKLRAIERMLHELHPIDSAAVL